MSRFLCSLIFLLISTSLMSQSSEMIVPFYNNGKWGFMNKNKDIIVCPKYEEAFPSTSGRYRVKLKGKYGYIDTNGKMVIKAKYDEAEDFNFLFADVKRKGKSYNIDIHGRKNQKVFGRCGTHYCTRPRISRNLEIVNGRGKYGFIHNKIMSDTIKPMFDTIVPLSYQLMYLEKDNLKAISHEGTYWSNIDSVIQNLKFEYEEVKLFRCDFCGQGTDDVFGVKKNGFWGFIKEKHYNDDFISPKYYSIESLADGFALVEYEIGKYGYIDQQGNEYFIR